MLPSPPDSRRIHARGRIARKPTIRSALVSPAIACFPAGSILGRPTGGRK
jgi:hypothetical protein